MLDLTKNQVFNADCLKILEMFPDNSIDVCLTDPPYGIDFQSNARSEKLPKILNDNEPFIEWIEPLFSKMREGGRLLCFYRWDVQDAFLNEIKRVGFTVKSQIVWNKNQPGMGDLKGEFAPSHELIIYATKGRYEFNGKRPNSVYNVNRIASPEHPNEKPVKLLQRIINDISVKNELFFEPFAGSFSTYIAATSLERICITTELHEEYYKRGIERLKYKTNENDFF